MGWGWGFTKPRWYNAGNRKSTYRRVDRIEFWGVSSGVPGDDTSISSLMTIHYAPKNVQKNGANVTTPLVRNEDRTYGAIRDPAQAVTLSSKGYTLEPNAKVSRKAFTNGHVMFKLHSENGWGGKPKADGPQKRSPFDKDVLSGHLYFSGTEADIK